MSGLFSFFSSKPAKENLEAVLAELDENIRCTQISINEIRLQRDKNSSSTLLYLILGYFLYIGIYTLLLRDPGLDTWGESFSKFAPIVVIPIAIYYIWTLGNYYYEKQLDAEKTKLRTLTEKKVLKIEEIKNSSSYNKTRTILERYGDERKGERSIERQSSRSLVPANPVASSQKLRSTSQSTRLIENQRPAPRNNQSQNLKQYSSTPSLKKAAPRPQTLRSTPSSGWLDRIVDAIVGEETTENKVVVASQGARQFALVCMHCFSHNGLVTDIEYDSMSYNCPKCSRFNPSRRSLRRQNQQNRDPRGQPQMLRASTGALTNAKPRSDELKSSYSSGRVRIKEPTPISDEEADAVASDDSGFVEKKTKSKASTSQQAYPTETK